ncbi:uncharacterized protein [Temnothorax nylanderi]|uniref:uncharacterized protein n=1 Tax=Temnothorax nylanderi TaxID=102681 RepID=UPI003A84D43C
MNRINGENNAHKCEIATFMRQEANNPPQECNDGTRICNQCNIAIANEIRILEQDPNCIRLNVVRGASGHSYFLCNARNNLHRLSLQARVNIFVKVNIFVPEFTKTCIHHLDENDQVLNAFIDGLQSFNRPYILRGEELLHFLQGLRACANKHINAKYNNETDFSDDEFKDLTSLTKAQFNELYEYCDPIPVQGGSRYVQKKHLITFLCKLRQGITDVLLKIIFQYPTRQSVSLAISTVRQSLALRFVPENIGFGAIDRNTYIQRHVTDFSNRLYNPQPETRRAIVVIDGTYTKVEKSSNFRVLRQTFCRHKGHHLLKPALLVAPDGYILAIQGPYFSDARNNDAAMLLKEFNDDVEGMRAWFEEGDIVLVDRGYRDATDFLEGIGIRYEIPAFLQRNERQLSTEDANRSRLLTKSRWIVESRNGHLKSIFKFFDKVVPYAHVLNLKDFYGIAGGLINRFHEPIIMEGANEDLARAMLQRAQEVNVLKARVEVDNLFNRRGQWVLLDENQVQDFPHFDLQYLRDLCFGVYQVNLAPGYIQNKRQREANEVFEYDQNRLEPNLLRLRIHSRHQNRTKYQLWISYNNDNDNDDPPITGYYCTCKSGARTLGSCAHVASALWYLGYARHEQNVKYPPTTILHHVLDAGNRPLPADENIEVV